jgi:hypothetical protein
MKRYERSIAGVIVLMAAVFIGNGFFLQEAYSVTPQAAAKALAAATRSQNAAWKSHYYYKAAQSYYEAADAVAQTGMIVWGKGNKAKAKRLLKESQEYSRRGDYYYDLAEKYRKDAVRQGLGGLLRALGH